MKRSPCFWKWQVQKLGVIAMKYGPLKSAYLTTATLVCSLVSGSSLRKHMSQHVTAIALAPRTLTCTHWSLFLGQSSLFGAFGTSDDPSRVQLASPSAAFKSRMVHNTCFKTGTRNITWIAPIHYTMSLFKTAHIPMRQCPENWEWSQWNMDLWNHRISRLLHLFAHLLVAPAWGNTCPSTWQPLPSHHTHSLALIDLSFCENEQKTRFLTSNIHTDTCVFHFLTL